MKDRITFIRSIHKEMKNKDREAELDLLSDPDNVGANYFVRAEEAKGRAENVCDDDKEAWEDENAPISRLFDRHEQFEKEFKKLG